MGEGAKDVKPGDGTSAETAVLRAEIEQKRAEISETLDEIQGRLRPGRIVSSARDAAATRVRQARGAAETAASRTVEQAREHPWSAAAAAAGVGAAAWWLARRSRDDDELWEAAALDAADQVDISEEALYRDFGDDFVFVEGEDRLAPMVKAGAVPVVLSGLALGWWLWSRRRTEEGPYAGTENTWNGGAYGSAGADAGSYRTFDERRWQDEHERGGAVSRTVSGVASRARGIAAAAGERTRGAAERAQRQIADRASTASNRLAAWVDQNPLGAGAIALFAGLLIGLAVPESNRERRLMSGARNRLIDNAQRAGRQAVARARDTVLEAATAPRQA